MCSVVGYVGNDLSKKHVIKGLTRLEYRGYDSTGFACLNAESKMLDYCKVEGCVKNLVDTLAKRSMDGHVGIGHTRWATHGVVSEKNAHPQIDCHQKISVVHNGIIENHLELRSQLRKSHFFVSDTDTEVVAHFLEEAFEKEAASVDQVLSKLVNVLQGAYALEIIAEQFPDSILVARKDSPLCIGLGENEIFVASDLIAFAGLVKKVIFLPNESFAIVRSTRVDICDFSGNVLEVAAAEMPSVDTFDTAHGYEHYMLKEIFEQKNAIKNTAEAIKKIDRDAFLDQCGINRTFLRSLQPITLIGCGSSWHAGILAEFYFQEIANISARAELASEYRYKKLFNEKQALYLAISQSGETADTLEAVKCLRAMGVPTLALANVRSSSLVRESGGFFLTQAGPEISVASTKAFTSQLCALYIFAHVIAYCKGNITNAGFDQAFHDLVAVADILEFCIEAYQEHIIADLAPRYAFFEKFIFLGRHNSYPLALEGALKLKEISYLFAQAYPAGELKHGAIALLSPETPVILFSSLENTIYKKLISNAQEIKARNGHIILFAFQGQDELIALADCVFIIPRVNPSLGPLAMTGLMQFFIYQIALTLERPIDKPRNLAKSVTVE